MFGTKGPEFQCVERYVQNSNVWKDRARILMFGRIRLERSGQNCSVWNDKVRIPMFGIIRSEFQWLEG